MARCAKQTPAAEAVDLADLSLGQVPGDEIEREYKGNIATISAKIRREITSLEELIDFFQIDLEVWKIVRWKQTNGNKRPLIASTVVSL